MALLDQNKKHFHQAADTPFGSGILQDLMGFSGLSEAATLMVDGTFLDKHKMPDLLLETKQLIMELAMSETIKTLNKPISREITRGDFMDGIKKLKECTSTSPSGWHLGHYKVMVWEAEDKNLECEINFMDIMVKMINLLVMYGFAMTQWLKSITCMIEKDLGNPQIERLQIIHLFEADYNFILKLLWGCWLVYQGEDNKCFGNQQFGSHPGWQAIEAVHMKTLTYDLAQTLLISLATFDNDASGCFDRIIVALGMIAVLWLFMPRSVVRMHVRVLANMKYYVKTAHGILERFYWALHSYLLFGTGQGSGMSPSVWLTLVCPGV